MLLGNVNRAVCDLAFVAAIRAMDAPSPQSRFVSLEGSVAEGCCVMELLGGASSVQRLLDRFADVVSHDLARIVGDLA